MEEDLTHIPDTPFQKGSIIRRLSDSIEWVVYYLKDENVRYVKDQEIFTILFYKQYNYHTWDVDLLTTDGLICTTRATPLDLIQHWEFIL